MATNVKKVEDNLEAVSTLLKSISNNRRLVIVCALAKSEKSVGQLQKIVNLSQSALSQHLARLRHDGIVKTRRSAQTIYYSIKCTKAEQILKSINKIYDD